MKAVATHAEGLEHRARARTGGRIVLDRYELLERLGSGGMGTVWRALDHKLDREVAVKRIGVDDADTARRADREGVAAARLQHPAIVALYESVCEEDAVWHVSELVRGDTLATLLAEGLLCDREVLAIGSALCDALIAAHRQGIVHRDVKPQNILVPDPELAVGGAAAKLTDFGIAQLAESDALTRTGDIVGTLAYMAPEQADGRGAGPQSDLYSLGLCIYEALAGVNPVRGRGVGGTARRVGQRLPSLGRLRRDLPLELCDAIDRAVWPEVSERGSLSELRAALRGAAPSASELTGTIAGAPLEPIAGSPDPAYVTSSLRDRVAAALAAAVLAAAPALILGTGAAGMPAWAMAAAAVVAVSLMPRLGWIAVVALMLAALAGERSGLALTGLVVLAPVPLLLRRAAPWSWSLPGLAGLAGFVGLAAAAPGFAVRLRSPLHRVLFGATCWWAVVVAELSGAHTLLVPGVGRHQPRAAGDGLPPGIIAAVGDEQTLFGALVIILASLTAPWFVRAGQVEIVIFGAMVWAGSTAVALALLCRPDRLEVVAAVAGGAAVLVAARRRPAPAPEPHGLA